MFCRGGNLFARGYLYEFHERRLCAILNEERKKIYQFTAWPQHKETIDASLLIRALLSAENPQIKLKEFKALVQHNVAHARYLAAKHSETLDALEKPSQKQSARRGRGRGRGRGAAMLETQNSETFTAQRENNYKQAARYGHAAVLMEQGVSEGMYVPSKTLNFALGKQKNLSSWKVKLPKKKSELLQDFLSEFEIFNDKLLFIKEGDLATLRKVLPSLRSDEITMLLKQRLRLLTSPNAMVELAKSLDEFKAPSGHEYFVDHAQNLIYREAVARFKDGDAYHNLFLLNGSNKEQHFQSMVPLAKPSDVLRAQDYVLSLMTICEHEELLINLYGSLVAMDESPVSEEYDKEIEKNGGIKKFYTDHLVDFIEQVLAPLIGVDSIQKQERKFFDWLLNDLPQNHRINQKLFMAYQEGLPWLENGNEVFLRVIEELAYAFPEGEGYWIILGDEYLHLRRFEEAHAAYRKAWDLGSVEGINRAAIASLKIYKARSKQRLRDSHYYHNLAIEEFILAAGGGNENAKKQLKYLTDTKNFNDEMRKTSAEELCSSPSDAFDYACSFIQAAGSDSEEYVVEFLEKALYCYNYVIANQSDTMTSSDLLARAHLYASQINFLFGNLDGFEANLSFAKIYLSQEYIEDFYDQIWVIISDKIGPNSKSQIIEVIDQDSAAELSEEADFGLDPASADSVADICTIEGVDFELEKELAEYKDYHGYNAEKKSKKSLSQAQETIKIARDPLDIIREKFPTLQLSDRLIKNIRLLFDTMGTREKNRKYTALLRSVLGGLGREEKHGRGQKFTKAGVKNVNFHRADNSDLSHSYQDKQVMKALRTEPLIQELVGQGVLDIPEKYLHLFHFSED